MCQKLGNNVFFHIRFEALHGGISISFWFAVTPYVYLNYREAEVQVLKKEPYRTTRISTVAK